MGKIRVNLARFLINSSNFCYQASRKICLCSLKPKDLIALSQSCYSRHGSLKYNYDPEHLNSGLNPNEKHFIETYVPAKSNVLVLGCGAGRESLALVKNGYRVTGIDFVKENIDAAKENFKELNLHASFFEQEISNIRFEPGRIFDAVMFSGLIYSLIPSKKIRINILKNLTPYLSQSAKIYLNFFSIQNHKERTSLEKITSALTFGNLNLESGDTVIGDGEFRHYFNEQSIKSELKDSGFKSTELNLKDESDSFAVISI